MREIEDSQPTQEPMTPEDIPDTATCYVPGYGETTVGALRATLSDPTSSTVAMWGFIATHPKAKPWGSRRVAQAMSA